MRTYGATIFEKNGFAMVEVLEVDAVGVTLLTGYVIRDPDGNESDIFQSYDDAVAELERLADDFEPPQGYGM